MIDLPESWVRVALRDLGRWQGGGTPSKAAPHYWGGPIPWVSPKDMKTAIIRESIDGITEAAVANSAASVVPAGSILIVTRSGILAHSLPVAINAVDVTVNQDLKALTPLAGLLPEYLALAFRANERAILNGCVKDGTTVHSVEMPALAEYEIPLAPLPEQHRIVAKIEALFSELDKAVESLTLARAQLKTYRQALLKYAFEGKLTADWRAANAGKLETPEALLSRIRKEREARYLRAFDDWQTALAEWRACGELGRKPKRPVRFAEISSMLVTVDSIGCATFPLDYLIGEVQQGWSPTCDGNLQVGPDDWAIVKTTAVQHGHYSDHAIKKLPANLTPRPDIEIGVGDFLMTRKGPRVRTGVVCLVRKTRHRIMLCDTVYRFGCDEELIYPPLLEMALNSPNTLRELDALKAGISESGISLNHGKIRSVSIAFPVSYQEQKEVVQILEEKLSSVDVIEIDIDTALAKANALRQSILKQAFSGRLVAQDPADEPASALLARLRGTAPVPKTRRKKTA